MHSYLVALEVSAIGKHLIAQSAQDRLRVLLEVSTADDVSHGWTDGWNGAQMPLTLTSKAVGRSCCIHSTVALLRSPRRETAKCLASVR